MWSAELPLLGSPYLNLGYSTFHGVPIPIEGNTLYVRDTWNDSSPTILRARVGYYEYVVHWESDETTETRTASERPIVAKRYPAGGTAPAIETGFDLTFDLPASVSFVTATFDHFASVPYSYGTSHATFTPRLYLSVSFRWLPAGPEDGLEAGMGHLTVGYSFWYGFDGSYVIDIPGDGIYGSTNVNQLFWTSPDQEFGVEYFDHFFDSVANDGVRASGYSGVAPAPEIATFGTYSLELVYFDGYNQAYLATLNASASPFGPVTGAVREGSAYQWPDDGDDATPRENLPNGSRVGGFVFALPVTTPVREPSSVIFPGFAAAQPVMLSVPGATLRRPGAGGSSSFFGLTAVDDPAGWCADATTIGGKVHAVYANSSEVAISVDGEEVYRQPRENWLPPGVTLEGLRQHQRFLMPNWLEHPAFLEVTAGKLVVRAVGRGERPGASWGSGPRPPLVYAYTAPNTQATNSTANLEYDGLRGGLLASASGGLEGRVGILNQPLLGEPGARNAPRSVRLLGSAVVTFSKASAREPAEVAFGLRTVLAWLKLRTEDAPVDLVAGSGTSARLGLHKHGNAFVALYRFDLVAEDDVLSTTLASASGTLRAARLFQLGGICSTSTPFGKPFRPTPRSRPGSAAIRATAPPPSAAGCSSTPTGSGQTWCSCEQPTCPAGRSTRG